MIPFQGLITFECPHIGPKITQSKKEDFMKPNKTYQTISAVCAFVSWFSWTYFINNKSEDVLLSSIVQGLISAVITIFMVQISYVLYHKCRTPKAKIFLPPLVLLFCCGLVGAVIHKAIGTSQIFYTLMPSLIIGFIFSLITCLKIQQSTQESKSVK